MNHRMRLHRLRPMNTAIALLASSLLAATANAVSTHDPDAENVTETIRYDDLDIDSSAGREALLKRINSAVARVCKATHDARTGLNLYHRCKRKSLDDALTQIDQIDPTHDRLRASDM